MKNMGHIVKKSIFCTLFTIVPLCFTKLLLSHFNLPFPLAPLSLVLTILPLVISIFNSLFNHSTKLPPGPFCIPIFGNWLQVGNDLNHRILTAMSQTYGPVFLLKLGSKNLTFLSEPELANKILHSQGVEFGSRSRNVVFNQYIYTGHGQDMVFTIYGDHSRKMQRIMTLPFFTHKVVNHYCDMREEEMDIVVDDLRSSERVKKEGVVIRKCLQMMLYNITYRMMFDAKFESQDDPLFIETTKFNSERSRLAQSFEYNYGNFIPLLRPFLWYLNKCKDLQRQRLAFFNKMLCSKKTVCLFSV